MLDDGEIPSELFHQVLKAPEQVVTASKGNLALQSRVNLGGRAMLLRVIIDAYTEPPTAVTVYLTTNISKYWSNE